MASWSWKNGGAEPGSLFEKPALDSRQPYLQPPDAGYLLGSHGITGKSTRAKAKHLDSNPSSSLMCIFLGLFTL